MRLERPPTYANLKAPTISAIVFLSILGCAIRPSPNRWLLYLPIFLLTSFFVFYIRTDDLLGDYSQSMGLGTNLFVMSDFLLLTDVQNELWRKGEARASIVYASFLQRLKWALDLHTSMRGIGWQHQPTAYLPPSSPSPLQEKGGAKMQTTVGWRRQFVLRQLVELGKHGLLFTVANLAMEMNSSFRANGPPFNEQVWWLRPTVFGHALAGRAAMSATYVVCSIVSVSLGISPADAWPPLFGSWLEAYSVHNFWRFVWHQMMRRFLTAHMKVVVSTFKPRSKAIRGLMQLYAAFLISAIIHYMGDIVLLSNWNGTAAKFFLLQATAIAFETLVASLVQISRVQLPHLAVRAIGYAWVISWFLVTVPIWLQPIVKSGLVDDGWHNPLIFWIAERLKVQLGIETR